MAGFEPIRAAARAAIESLGMRPVMAETSGASAASAQRALLDDVAASDVYLLILGERYGVPGASGVSPTEEEFEEAVRRNKPILVMRHAGVMEPMQRRLLERAGGQWENGQKWDEFTGESDIGLKIVRALERQRQSRGVRELAPQAQQRARELAQGDRHRGFGSSGSRARVALVPLIDVVLMDDVTLDDPALPDRLAQLARTSGLVPQVLGIDQKVARSGISLSATGDRRGDTAVAIEVGSDGAVMVEGSVSGADSSFGSMRVDPERLETLVDRVASFAVATWGEIDRRSDIQHVAAAVGIPGANGKVFGRPSQPTNSISMGGAMAMPQDVVAPDPARLVRRLDVPGEELPRQLVAAVKRVFADCGALEKS